MEERPSRAAEGGRSGDLVSGASAEDAAAAALWTARSALAPAAMEITLRDPSTVAVTDSTTSTKDVGAEMTPYQKLVHSLHHDKKIINEVSLGRRVGFYRFRGDLGTGNFSKVKMAVHQLCKERVAVKILDKSKLDHKTYHMLNREIKTMDKIHHPNIIRLYEVLETYRHIYLVLEYANGGELFNKITSSGRFPESEARVLFVQISSAVKYMHENNIIHRDIKAENVFFAAPAVVKLGDFGFSIHLKEVDQQLTTFCGSPPYAAPELFCDESYLGAPVDIWALGVLLYFMITGQMPFKAQTVATLKKHIMDVNYSVPNHVSENCKTVIEGILKHAPRDRLSFDDIERSEWLKDCPFPLPPKPAEKYSMLPTILPVEKNGCPGNTKTGESATEDDDIRVSEVEMKAREQLHKLGITEKLLSEHAVGIAKGAVIGTYRIVVHRLQRQDTVACEIENETLTTRGSSNNSGFSQSAISSGHKFPLYLRRRSKSAAVKSNCPKAQKNRSRTCVLL